MEHVMDSTWLRCILIILYSVIFLLGIVGNLLILYVIVRNRSMQTITNIFIANLALSDILMCIIELPFRPLAMVMKGWKFGAAMCHIMAMSMELFVFVSMLTFTAIAIRRCFITVYPLKSNLKWYFALPVIGAIWVISICVSLPLAVRSELTYLKRFKESEILHCIEDWPSHLSRDIYAVACLVIQYVVPCIIIALCYIYSSLVVRSGPQDVNRDQMESRSNRRTNNMLVVVAAIFVCCWLPKVIYHLIIRFADPSIFLTRYLLVIFLALHITAMCSAIYNPFLYAWMDDKFRNKFNAVFQPLSFCRRRTTANSPASVNTTADADKIEMQEGNRNN